MEVIYGLIPGMIILGLVAVGVLFWAARSGQFDDLEGDAHRILMDDDLDSGFDQKKDGGTAEGQGQQSADSASEEAGKGSVR